MTFLKNYILNYSFLFKIFLWCLWLFLFYCFGVFWQLQRPFWLALLQVPSAEWDRHEMSFHSFCPSWLHHDHMYVNFYLHSETTHISTSQIPLCVLTEWQTVWPGATVFGLQRVRTKDSIKGQNGVMRSLRTEKAGRRNRERIKYESTKIELQLGCENTRDKKTVWQKWKWNWGRKESDETATGALRGEDSVSE